MMKSNTACTENIKQKKDDSKEFVELLKRVPPERKDEVLGFVIGFVTCIENEKKVG